MTDDSSPAPQKRSTCLTILGIGCLVVIVIIAATGALFYFKGTDIVRTVAAFGAEYAVEEMLKGMQLPQGEREAAMAPVREFTQKVKDGKVSKEQAGKVLEEVAKGPVSVVVMSRVFEVMYLEKSSLSAEEKKAGHVAVSRFAHGTAEGKIAREKGKEILDIVTVKKPGSDKSELKQTITPEELKKCLTIAKDAADAAGIADKEHIIDLPGEIRKAIDKGMQASPPPAHP